MLKSVELENYKCFKESTKIDIVPLTVLCGINSSGKSSILKSLLMLKQSYENNSHLNSITFNGNYTNNGLFGNVAFSKNSPVRLTNTFNFSAGSYMTQQEKNAFKDMRKIMDDESITEFSLIVSILFKGQNRKNLSLGDNIVNQIHIVITTQSTTIDIKLDHISDFRYDITLSGLPSLESQFVTLKNTVCYFDGLQIVNLYYSKVEPQQKTDSLLADIFSIFRIIAQQYKDINYISPLRNAPERRYIIEHDVENVGIYGEYVPQILEKYKASSAKINKLPADDVFSKSYANSKNTVSESTNNWLQYFGIDQINIEADRDLLRLDIGNHNILDVGFGVSQALPIIVAGNTLPFHSTLLLEQPEVHLHPKMQMCMADLLIAISMAHKNVIFETHSDHIINRIVRRMMENKNIMKNTRIIFIDKDEVKNPMLVPIEVDSIKGILTDNKNFFQEFASETDKILYAGYQNMIGKNNGDYTFR